MQLREDIILAAISEFKDKGLKFTMDDIARCLGISKKTIYTVFLSKEEIMDAVADYVYAQIKCKEQEIFDRDDDVVNKIHDIIIALPDGYRELDFRKLDGLKEKFPNIYRKVVNNIEGNWDNTMSLIRQGIDEGKIRPVNLVILKEMIEASIEKFIGSSSLDSADISYNDALEQMMNIIMQGLII